MFEPKLFEDARGKSEVRDFLIEQDRKALGDKRARTWMKQFDYAMARLKVSGTRCGEELTKLLRDGIWELRVGAYRIPFFLDGNKVVLSNVFRKTSNRTPAKEIEKAKRNREAWTQNHEQSQGD